METLEGRVALITGAGTGMGRAALRLFAESGARVVAVGRTEATLIDAVGGLDDARYPRSRKPLGCDLMARDFRRGHAVGGTPCCNGDDAARGHHAFGFGQCLPDIPGILDGVEAGHQIEAVVFKWQGLQIPHMKMCSRQSRLRNLDQCG